MARQVFHAQIQAENGTQSTDLTTKAQLDAGVASALSRSNHTGTQLAETISDFESAVDARFQLVVDGAPSALDTLNELAAALGDDPAFSATVTTSLGALDTRIDALEASAGTGGYKVNIGDATAATFTITHNLGTLDTRVDVVRVSDGQTVYPVVTRPSTNTVAIDFGATVIANTSHRVLVSSV